VYARKADGGLGLGLPGIGAEELNLGEVKIVVNDQERFGRIEGLGTSAGEADRGMGSEGLDGHERVGMAFSFRPLPLPVRIDKLAIDGAELGQVVAKAEAARIEAPVKIEVFEAVDQRHKAEHALGKARAESSRDALLGAWTSHQWGAREFH
jgi:hypothetical protein